MRPLNLSDYDYLMTHDVRPAANMGATVTPGNDTMGSWATVLSTALVGDYHGVMIYINSLGANATITDALVDFGWDPAGGTNYGASALTIIPYLLATMAGAMRPTGPLIYYFPLLIPGGSTLGARAQVHNAAVPTARVHATLFKARRPMDAVFGTQVLSYGEDTANSRGTSVTYSNAGDGTWTQIGSAIAAPAPWAWLAAGALTNSSVSSADVDTHLDLGFGSSSSDARLETRFMNGRSSSEQQRCFSRARVCTPANGDKIFVRGRTGSNTANNVMVHGVI